jgi:hypothetical protein
MQHVQAGGSSSMVIVIFRAKMRPGSEEAA